MEAESLRRLKVLLSTPAPGKIGALDCLVIEQLVASAGLSQVEVIERLRELAIPITAPDLSRRLARLRNLGFVAQGVGRDGRTRKVRATSKGAAAVAKFDAWLRNTFSDCAVLTAEAASDSKQTPEAAEKASIDYETSAHGFQNGSIQNMWVTSERAAMGISNAALRLGAVVSVTPAGRGQWKLSKVAASARTTSVG